MNSEKSIKSANRNYKAKYYAKNTIKTLILPVAVYLILYLGTGGRFGSIESIMPVLRTSIIMILIAMGIGFNMFMRMWDFSAGAVVLVSGILASKIAVITNTGILGVFLFCMVIAISMTLINALLYNLLKLPSMVLTMGLVMCYEGLPRLFKIDQGRIDIKDGFMAQAPWCFIVLVVMFVIFYLLFNKTVFGHNVKAIGADPKIANSAGINIAKTKLFAFLWAGIYLGLAGFMYLSNRVVVSPPFYFSSALVMFNAMMGVFIAFFLINYCNYAIGIIVGIITMTLVNNGLVPLGMSSMLRDVAAGIFLMILLIISSNRPVVEDMRKRKKLAKIADEQYRMQQKVSGNA